MRKIFITLAIAMVLLVPVFVLAANDYGLKATLSATDGALKDNVGGATSISALAGKIVAAGLSLFAIIFFVLFLYAGFTWMKAMGNSEDVTKAKDTIIAAIIGLVIVAASYAATKFVFDRLGVTSGGGGVATGSHKDGEVCKIENNNWAQDGSDIIRKDGQWNCGPGTKKNTACDTGECQPACRYSVGATAGKNKDGKCGT